MSTHQRDDGFSYRIFLYHLICSAPRVMDLTPMSHVTPGYHGVFMEQETLKGQNLFPRLDASLRLHCFRTRRRGFFLIPRNTHAVGQCPIGNSIYLGNLGFVRSSHNNRSITPTLLTLLPVAPQDVRCAANNDREKSAGLY
jgi:hypothetical protein